MRGRRVVHVNDVSRVASTIVEAAQDRGLPWTLWRLPPVNRTAPVSAAWGRGRDVMQFRQAAATAALAHVHYGFFGYYAWVARRPYVLHLHGSDVRLNLRDRVRRPIVLRAMARAEHVLYSTPDLSEEVCSIRPDATWLAAPVPRSSVAVPVQPGAGGAADVTPGENGPLVLFASRWDEVKGIDEQLDLAADLRRSHPGARLVGVRWGEGADRAEAAGVRLVPKLAALEFERLLGASDVVVGQQRSGMLGITELQAMAMGRPVVARFDAAAAYGEDAPIWNTLHVDAGAAVLQVLEGGSANSHRVRAAVDWVARHHSADAAVTALEGLYRRVSYGTGASHTT